MKEIVLTQNFVAQVDDEDYEYLNQWKWRVMKSGKTYYAGRSGGWKNYKQQSIYMHRVVAVRMGLNVNSLHCDHIDRNGLNNQRNNIRKATRNQNRNNSINPTTCNYRGIYYNKRLNKFIARLTINGKITHLGCFDNAIDAAKKYDRMVLKYRGEFAITNFEYAGN